MFFSAVELLTSVQYDNLRVALLPVSKDVVLGPSHVQTLAYIYVMVGKYDEVIREIEDLLPITGGLSISFFKLDPAWDPILSHPRFQKLLKSGK